MCVNLLCVTIFPSLFVSVHMETNPKLGISDYDYHYRACRCVYCNEIVLLTNETLDILTEEEIARLRRENVARDYFFLTSEDERGIRERLRECYKGIQLDYDQCIHDRCLALVLQPENSEVLERIRLANRTNMILPNAANDAVFPIDYTNVRECLNLCAYCRQVITAQNPGFAYCPKSDRTRTCLFLHIKCYEDLVAMRAAAKERDLLARRNFIHLLTKDPASAWANYSVREMAARNDAWFTFISQYELTVDERDALQEWLDFLSNQQQQSTWCSQEWLEALRQDDLTRLVAQDLTALSLEQLAELEAQLRAQVQPPVPCFITRCIPAPRNPNLIGECPRAEDIVLCKRPDASGQSPLLYLNLVQTLRQARTPPVQYSVFSNIR